MKKLLLLSTLIITSLCINAQGLKGTWFVGGEFSYSKINMSKTVEDVTVSYDRKSTMILPVLGTFISPDVAVGAGLGYISQKDGDDDAVDRFVVRPLVRKYWNISGPIFLFGQASAPMIFGDDYTNIGVDLSPGIDFVVTSWMTIETSFTIFNFNYTKEGDVKNWGVGANPFNSIADRQIGDLQVGVKFLF